MSTFYASYPVLNNGATGTVTSVGLADGSSTPIYNISGSPVTGSGTLTFSLKTETANEVFAGPTTGSAAQPTFRALVAADIPSGLSYISQLTGDVTAGPGSGSVAATVAAIQGTTVSGTTGTSDVVFNNGPTLVAPALGTPISGVMTNVTGTASGLTSGLTNALKSATTTVSVSSATAPSSGQVLTATSSTTAIWQAPATSGTVTSVGLADTSTTPIYTVTNSPVTSSGTIDITLNTQNANTVHAGPTSGGAAQPTFRALVAADLPSLSGTYLVKSNNLSDVSSASTSFNNISPMTTAGDIIYGGTSGAGTRLAKGTSSQVLLSGTTPSWGGVPAGTNPTQQIFTSGSGTYTTPTGVVWIRVRGIGGGGGGSGSGTLSGGGGNGSNGNNTTFGTSLLVGDAGTGGSFSSGLPTAGGSASVGAASGYIIPGGAGAVSPYTAASSTVQIVGGSGGSGPFGGAGCSTIGSNGTAGATNSGSGGGGGGGSTTATSFLAGVGGGAGGYFEAWIGSPSSSYSYGVGAGGGGGTAGTSGFTGGAGAAGILIVEEFYYA